MSLVVQKYTPAVWGSEASSSKYSSASYSSDTELSGQFDRTKRLTGSNAAACSTEAEYKADKLNRTEEVKLRNLKYQVGKAQEIKRRQYKHKENILRIKSASLASRLKGIEDSWSLGMQISSPSQRQRILDKREVSELSTIKCNTCAELQTIVELYEKEGKHKGLHASTRVHSTCVFSNGQINMFLKMLEAKYLPEIPGVKMKLRDSGASSIFLQAKNEPTISRRQVDIQLAFRDVEHRIRKFCGELEHFNKENGTVSKQIRDKLEQVRISNAVMKKPNVEGQKLNLRQEVERLLKL